MMKAGEKEREKGQEQISARLATLYLKAAV